MGYYGRSRRKTAVERAEDDASRARRNNMRNAGANALARIEGGQDAAVRTTSWVRSLAVDEAQQGGEFMRTLERRCEPGWGDLARETFGSLYGLGTMEVSEADAPTGSEWQREALSQAMSLPEWQALGKRAEGDAWATSIAASAALDVLAARLPQLPDESPADVEEQIQFLGDLMRERGQTSPKHLRKLGELKKRHEKAVEQSAATTQGVRSELSELRSALRGAAQQAGQEIAESEEAASGFGAGEGSMDGTRCRVTAPRSEIIAECRANPSLARIARLAGRLKAQAARKQAQKTRQQRSELTDIQTGDDVARLLPAEYALLADPDTELLLYAKLADRRALQYELQANVPKTEGPLVIAIDESGSMCGEAHEWSKAVALALCDVAAKQGRAFAVVHFDARVQHTQVFENPRSMAWSDMLDLCTHFSGGGTNLHSALTASAKLITDARAANSKLGRADIVLVTDVEYCAPMGALIKQIADDAKASVFGIAINGRFAAETTEQMAGYEVITRADLNGPSDKLDAVFSV